MRTCTPRAAAAATGSTRRALMTAEMWKMTVARMQGEMARRGAAPLNADEQAALLDYLDRTAADESSHEHNASP